MPFDRQPTLSGPTLQLRPLSADDRDAFLAVAADPLIWEQHPESDRHEPDTAERFFADALASGGAMVVLRDGKLIGASRFEVPEGESVLVDHTFLDRAHWTDGSYLELKRLMFEHVFASFPKVQLRVGVENTRTRGAVEDILGAQFVGTVDGPLGEDAVYEVSREGGAA